MTRSLPTLLILIALLIVPSTLPAQLLWEPADRGIEGAAIHTYSEAADGTMFASTDLGLYRYDDGSKTWSRVIDAFYGYDWNVVTAPDGTLHSWRIGHRVSTDRGRTWTSDGATTQHVAAVDEAGAIVLLGGGNRSTDLGTSWTPSSITGLDAMLNLGGGRLVGRRADSVFVSADTGRTWTHTATRRQLRTVMAAAGSNVVLGGFNATYLSTDAGVTWTETLPLPAFSASTLPGGEIIISSFGTDRSRPTDGIYGSLDSGRTWSMLSPGAHGAIHGSSSGAIWASRNSGPALSIDRGATWTAALAGLRERYVEVMADRDGDFHAYAPTIRPVLASTYALGELYHSSDDAASWRMILDSVGAYRPLYAGGLAAVTVSTRDSAGVTVLSSATHVTSDHGTTWRMLGNGVMVDAATDGTDAAAVVVGNPSDTSLHVTTDRGATWTRHPFTYHSAQLEVTPSGRVLAAVPADNAIIAVTNDGDTEVLLADRIVYELTAVSDDVLVAITSLMGQTEQRIERSTDGGATWTDRPLANHQGPITHVRGRLVLPLIVADSLYVMRSGDSGATWQQSVVGWHFGARTPSIAHNGTMLSLRYSALYRSMDYGATWEKIDSTRWRSALLSPITNGRVILQTQEVRGIHRTAFISSIAREHDEPAPLRLRPIPARDRVTIDGLDGTGAISIVDVTGRLLRTQSLDAGDRSIDIAGLAPGIYFVRFTSGRDSHIGTIVVAEQ